MKFRLLRGAFALMLTAVGPVASSQDGPPPIIPQQQEDNKLPNGKSQRDEILKAEHENNVKDASHLVDLAQSLKADLEKTDRFVLSMDTIKKTDDIEKLAKKIHDRLRH